MNEFLIVFGLAALVFLFLIFCALCKLISVLREIANDKTHITVHERSERHYGT